MQALAFALAGCMAMDVVHVLTKGEHDRAVCASDLTGQRAPDEPHRFTAIALHFTITGDVPADARRSRDRSVPRKVLLGLALDAAGHSISPSPIKSALALSGSPQDVKEAIGRRGYLDWTRGLAVLIMIQAHVLDSWTRLDVRDHASLRVGDDRCGFRCSAVPVSRRRVCRHLCGIEIAPHGRRTAARSRSSSAALDFSSWRFCFVSRPGYSDGARRERC